MRQFSSKISNNAEDVIMAQRFRSEVFRGSAKKRDFDAFDDVCKHVLIRDKQKDNKLVCVFRVLILNSGLEIEESYSAQHYNLDNLKKISGPILELGRFCVCPEYPSGNVIRLAWSLLAKLVLTNKVCFLFGCSSFKGTDEKDYLESFRLLNQKHLAPKDFNPFVKSKNVYYFSKKLEPYALDLKSAKKNLPPLLRYYLSLGGWVSDHAVKDTDLDTIHVFTGLNVWKIPERKRLAFAEMSVRL
ncbi:MAG: GNAT family N-acyltransferase [Pseudomonadota bacterium]|nr:GNAT family N-acyltransferase [Pseudomonadota bacterium]